MTGRLSLMRASSHIRVLATSGNANVENSARNRVFGKNAHGAAAWPIVAPAQPAAMQS